MLALWLAPVGKLAQRGLGSGPVDRLRRVLRHRTEGRVLSDAVPVAVGGDGAGVPSPRRCLARVAGWLTEWPRPGFSAVAGGVACVVVLWLVVRAQLRFWRYDALHPEP